MNHKIKYIILFIICFILLLEYFLKFLPEIENQKKYRKLHCFYNNYLFLCPKQNLTFKRWDSINWNVETNFFAERITIRTTLNKEYPEEIWFIGDSISFGYLVNNEDSTPFLLDILQSLPVRNLGVDTIGTIGIWERLKKGLEDHPNTKIQYLIWIYNTSDFTDDVKDINHNYLKQSLFKFHYHLSKYSNIYNQILYLKNYKKDIPIPETNEIDDSIKNYQHITFKNILRFYEFIKSQKRIKNFIIVIYPGMDIRTKNPDTNSLVTLSIYNFLKENNIPVMDVFEEFKNHNSPYFDFDGHPNEEGYKIFTISLIDHLKLK